MIRYCYPILCLVLSLPPLARFVADMFRDPSSVVSDLTEGVSSASYLLLFLLLVSDGFSHSPEILIPEDFLIVCIVLMTSMYRTMEERHVRLYGIIAKSVVLVQLFMRMMCEVGLFADFHIPVICVEIVLSLAMSVKAFVCLFASSSPLVPGFLVYDVVSLLYQSAVTVLMAMTVLSHSATVSWLLSVLAVLICISIDIRKKRNCLFAWLNVSDERIMTRLSMG